MSPVEHGEADLRENIKGDGWQTETRLDGLQNSLLLEKEGDFVDVGHVVDINHLEKGRFL